MSSQNQNKRKRHSIDNSALDIGLNITSTCDFSVQFPEFKTTCDFGAQFSKFEVSTYDFGVQVSGEFECEQTSKIQELQKQLENQRHEIVELSERLTKANEYIIKINDQYQEQYKQNEALVQKWDSQFSSQQKRIDSIVEIALAECKNVFNDVESLIRNNNRFSLDQIMKFTPQTWLNDRNQVIVKFIEILTQNDWNTNVPNQEKLFKRVVAVDAICRSHHEKYVSEINLAASAIKYSLSY